MAAWGTSLKIRIAGLAEIYLLEKLLVECLMSVLTLFIDKVDGDAAIRAYSIFRKNGPNGTGLPL